jgi:hypothetical protein
MNAFQHEIAREEELARREESFRRMLAHRASRGGRSTATSLGVIVSFQQIDTVAAGQAVACPMRRLGM